MKSITGIEKEVLKDDCIDVFTDERFEDYFNKGYIYNEKIRAGIIMPYRGNTYIDIGFFHAPNLPTKQHEIN